MLATQVTDFWKSGLEATLGIFNPWRLSGLLSGYLPTDTRPQARAKLGKTQIIFLTLLRKIFFRLRANFPNT